MLMIVRVMVVIVSDSDACEGDSGNSEGDGDDCEGDSGDWE